MSEIPDEDEILEDEGVFNFPLLVAVAYANWHVLCTALEPVERLNLAIARLASELPGHLTPESKIALSGAFKDLNEALTDEVVMLKVAEHANHEIAQAFEQLDRGMRAVTEIHRYAMTVGYGTA